MVRAFAPVLAANGGGAILNVLSAMSCERLSLLVGGLPVTTFHTV